MTYLAALCALLLLIHAPQAHAARRGESKRSMPVVRRVFAYGRQHADSLHGRGSRVYFKYGIQAERRNFTLFFVPSMYYLAKGRRHNVGEILGDIAFNERGDYRMERHATLTTVRHGGHGMSVILPYLTPDIYGATLFGNAMLSPLHAANNHYYRYRVSRMGGAKCRVSFRPRLRNAQLVTGYALVDEGTGRVEYIKLSGEHDMLRFSVEARMGGRGRGCDVLPLSCQTEASFKFLGNSMKTRVTALYDEGVSTLPPDSLRAMGPRAAMDSLRPVPLTADEALAYADRFGDGDGNDTVQQEKSRLSQMADKAWNFLGDNLLGSIGAANGNASVSMSPLLNPLYLSYSHSRGLAYKVRIGAHLDTGANSELALRPTVGYNFKISQFYYESPLRYTYDRRRDNYVELTWANGNRIANSSVLDVLRDERRDTVDFSALNLDYFNDETWRLHWNVNLGSHFGFRVGTVYHRRRAVNTAAMEELGKPTEYKSLAPTVKLTLRPFAEGPVLTVNYERSLRHALGSNTEYERWEFDGVYKKRLRAMRAYNLRVGGGLYTNRSTNYFVDFENFHENYLPGGYDDDWSGDFQLLNSQWYNASRYYARANASYESPLLLLSWLPWVGRYVEREALYASTLHIAHTRPYFELGYGFTTRYVSVGLFAALLNGQLHEVGAKFTFELFRKW